MIFASCPRMNSAIRASFVVLVTILMVQLLHSEKMAAIAEMEPPVANAIRYLEELDKFYTQKGRPR